jgi:hypothetical protein
VKKGLPRWFWVILGVFGLFAVLAIIAIIFFGSWFADVLGKPVDTVRQFYSALDAGRCDEARSLLTSDMQRIDYCARWNELEAKGTTNIGGLDGGVSINNGISRVDWALTAGGELHKISITLNEQMKISGSTAALLPAP